MTSQGCDASAQWLYAHHVSALVDAAEDWSLVNRRNLFRLPESRGGAVGETCTQLAHAVAEGDVLLHGSTNRHIQVFRPQEQTSARGRPTQAVFATPDAVWAMFFAVTDLLTARSRWNTCALPEETGLERTRYFFSVGCRPTAAWTERAIYLLPLRSFQVSDSPAEWVSTAAVEPVGVVLVTPADFPFRSSLFAHDVSDSAARRLLRLWVHSATTRRGHDHAAPQGRR